MLFPRQESHKQADDEIKEVKQQDETKIVSQNERKMEMQIQFLHQSNEKDQQRSMMLMEDFKKVIDNDENLFDLKEEKQSLKPHPNSQKQQPSEALLTVQ